MTDNEASPRPPANARELIDRLIVNGEVGDGQPVDVRTLGRIATGDGWERSVRASRLLARMRQDPRFVGGDEEAGFLFRPELTPGSHEKASWESIVLGKGIFTEDEASLVRMVMGEYTLAIYYNYNVGRRGGRIPGIISVHEIGPILRDQRDALAARGVQYTSKGYEALMAYMGLPDNDWFHLLDDGRVVLKQEFKGDIDKIKPLQPVADMQVAVEQALRYLGPRASVLASSVWRALEDLGYLVTRAQRTEFESCMSKIPGTKRITNRLFSYSPPSRSRR